VRVTYTEGIVRILVFSVPFTGHTNPLYPVLRRLCDTGAKVTVVNDESYRDPIERTGARFVPYPRGRAFARTTGDITPASMPGLAADLMAVANELLPFTLDAIDEERPDCVLHDAVACWALLALRRRSARGITLVTTFAFSLEMSNDRATPASRLRIVLQLLAALPRIAFRRLETRIRHRMRPLAIFETFMALDEWSIVFTSEEFQPESERFAERCYFVGPTASRREVRVEFPYDRLARDRTVVYISLGTIMQAPGLLQVCFRAFRGIERSSWSALAAPSTVGSSARRRRISWFASTFRNRSCSSMSTRL